MTSNNLDFYGVSMNPEAQAQLDNILSKSTKELRPHEIAFLRARRGYLKTRDKEKYKSFLKINTSKASKVADKAAKEKEKEEKLAYRELQKQAGELGMENVVGVSRADLEGFISTKVGPMDN